MRDIWPSLSRLVLRLMPLLLMAFVAGSTFWLVQINSPRDAETGPRVKRHEPDYFMEHFAASELALDGSTKMRFNGEKLLHFEDDQTYEVTRPAMRSFEPDRPPVSGRADKGLMDADATVIDLLGDAHIERPAGADPSKDPALSATSQFFRVLINDDIVKTDKPVQLTRGPSVMTANGMIFNNVTREVQLLGNVRGTIVMAPRAGDVRKP